MELVGIAQDHVKPEDLSAIADAVSRVLTDEVLAAALAKKGRQRAAGFGWDAMTQGLIASWRRALGLSDHAPGGEAQDASE